MFFGIVSLLRGIQNFNVLRALCVYILEYDRTKFTEFYRSDILSKFSFFFFFFLYIFNFYIIQSSIQDDLLIKSEIIRFLKIFYNIHSRNCVNSSVEKDVTISKLFDQVQLDR